MFYRDPTITATANLRHQFFELLGPLILPCDYGALGGGQAFQKENINLKAVQRDQSPHPADIALVHRHPPILRIAAAQDACVLGSKDDVAFLSDFHDGHGAKGDAFARKNGIFARENFKGFAQFEDRVFVGIFCGYRSEVERLAERVLQSWYRMTDCSKSATSMSRRTKVLITSR